MPKVYWSETKVGHEITPLTKPPITRVQMAKFAGATMDYNPLHIDDEYARSCGYGGAFSPGSLGFGILFEALSQSMENAHILDLTGTFRKLVWPGDTLTAGGTVIKHYKKHKEPRIDLEVWIQNQNQDIILKGNSTCILWENHKEENKSRREKPVISHETKSIIKSAHDEVLKLAKHH